MTRIEHLVNKHGFYNTEEITKFMFLIHSQHERVQDQLIKEFKDTTVAECLVIACKVESTIQVENWPSISKL